MRVSERGGIISRLLFLLAFCALLGLVYLARIPLLRLAGHYWVAGDNVQHADAIVVIGDDNYNGDRAFRAAELYRAGWAPEVVASGRMLRPYAGISELIVRDIESHGVPAASVVRFPHTARNTREEAQTLEGLAAQKGWHSILLVTSNYHTRRAGYIFRKVFPASIAVSVISATDRDFDPDSWWNARLGRKILFMESVSFCEAWWELHNYRSAGYSRQSLTRLPRSFWKFHEEPFDSTASVS